MSTLYNYGQLIVWCSCLDQIIKLRNASDYMCHGLAASPQGPDHEI